MTCDREGATPTDDGYMIVDCRIHGEVARVLTGGSIDRVAVGEYEAIEVAWIEHLRACR